MGQSNGSLTCPFAGGVTAGVHNEGGRYIYYPSLNDKDDKNDKESEKSPMRVIGRGLWKPCHCCHSCHGRWTGYWYAHLQCITDMPCMTLGESLTGVGYAQQAMATHAVQGSLYESYRGFVS